jgi:hypothetical protein
MKPVKNESKNGFRLLYFKMSDLKRIFAPENDTAKLSPPNQQIPNATKAETTETADSLTWLYQISALTTSSTSSSLDLRDDEELNKVQTPTVTVPSF